METIWLVLGFFILLALLLFFRKLFSDKNPRLLVSSWGDLQENQVLIDLINDFRKENPSFSIQLERNFFPKYVGTLLKDFNNGSGPDVIFVEANNFMDFFAQGALANLNPLIEADGLNLKTYYPQILDRFTVDNQIHALPRDIAPICMVYYNKKAFNESGIPYPLDDWDWGDFAETAKKLVKRDSRGKVLRWGVVENWAMADCWVYNAGGSYVDDPKHPRKWTFGNDPNTLKGIQFRSDLIYKHKVMPSPSSMETVDGLETSDLFAIGKAAMFISGIWKTPYFREKIRDFDWDAALFPRTPSGYQGFSSGGSGYAIFKNSKHKKHAWKFIKFITGESGARKLAATGLAQPALINITESSVFLDGKDPANKKLLLKAVQFGKYSPRCQNWWDGFSIINSELDVIWKGNQKVEEVMEKIQRRLDLNPPKAL